MQRSLMSVTESVEWSVQSDVVHSASAKIMLRITGIGGQSYLKR